MNTDLASQAAAAKASARFGAWTMSIVSFLVGLIVWLLAITWNVYRESTRHYDSEDMRIFLVGPMRGLLIMIFIALGIGILAFSVSAWLMGRWAGRRIVVHEKNYAWVGLRAMLLPALVAASVSLVVIEWLTEGDFFPDNEFFWDSLVMGLGFVMAWFLVTTLITGLFGGFTIRYLGRRRARLLGQIATGA